MWLTVTEWPAGRSKVGFAATRPAGWPDILTWAEELSRVYGGDIVKLDLTPAYTPSGGRRGSPSAEHRLPDLRAHGVAEPQSDRFFTRDYTCEVSTRAGLDWVEDNTMVTVLRRHTPTWQRPSGDANGIHPWASAAR